MKKLLVLVLVLALAPMSSALVQIGVGGTQSAEYTGIEIGPSDTLSLSIWNDTALTYEGATPLAMLALIVQTSNAAISGGTVNPLSAQGETPGPGQWDSSMAAVDLGDPPFLPVGEGMGGIFVGITVFSGTIAASNDLLTDILLHCEAANGETVISLVQMGETGPTGVVYDTLTITQIPEPATIALLCLGGLLLRKK